MRYFEAIQSRAHQIVEVGKFIGTTLILSGVATVAEARTEGLGLPANVETGYALIATGGLALIGALSIEDGASG